MNLTRPLRLCALAACLVLGRAPTALAVFDDLEVSPRARGLGGSYASLSDDADGVFYNPAGLVNVEEYDLFATIFQPHNLAFTKTNAVALAVPTDSFGNFAFGYQDFRVEYEGTTLSVERAFTFAHGLRLMEDLASSFSIGYALNFYNLDYPAMSVSGLSLGSESTFGLDVGIHVELYERTSAGVFLQERQQPRGR